MLKLMRGFSWPHLKSRKGRLFLTLMGIMLGVAIFSSISVVNRSTLESYYQLMDQMSGRASYQIVSHGNSGLPEELVFELGSVEGIEAAIPTVRNHSIIDGEANILVYGVDWELDGLVRDYEYVGKLSGNRDILLTESLANLLDVRIGDGVSLLTVNGFEEFYVSGLMSDKGAGRTNLGLFAIIPLESAQEVFQRNDKYDVIDIVLQRDSSLSAEEIQVMVGSLGLVERPASRGKDVESMLAGLQFLLGLAGSIALFVGVFLVYNNMSVSVQERRKEIALLRSLGMTRGGVLSLILSEAVIIGLLGSFLGFALGVILAGTVASGLSSTLLSMWRFNIGELSVNSFDIMVALGLGTTVAILAAFFPAKRAMDISPVEAYIGDPLSVDVETGDGGLRSFSGVIVFLIGCLLLLAFLFPEVLEGYNGEVLGSIGVGLLLLGTLLLLPKMIRGLSRVGRVVLRPLGFYGRLAADNLGRNIGRTTATVAALVIAVTMLLGMSAMSVSYQKEVEKWVDSNIGWDMLVTSSWFGLGSDVGISPEIVGELSEIEGVILASPERFTSIVLPEMDVTASLQVFDMRDFGQFAEFTVQEGPDSETLIKELHENGSIAISTQVAMRIGLGVGDHLLLPTPQGEQWFRIAGVVSDFGTGMGSIYMDRGEYIRYWQDERVDAVAINVEDGRVDEVAHMIESRWGQSHNLSVKTHGEFRADVDALVAESFLLTDSMAMLALLVGALGVVNTLLIAVLERRRELAILRATGATKRNIYWMVAGESLMMGLAGVILGIVLGSLVGMSMVAATFVSSGVLLEFWWPIEAMVNAVVVGLLLLPLIAYIPARIANRDVLSESLRFE